MLGCHLMENVYERATGHFRNYSPMQVCFQAVTFPFSLLSCSPSLNTQQQEDTGSRILFWVLQPRALVPRTGEIPGISPNVLIKHKDEPSVEFFIAGNWNDKSYIFIWNRKWLSEHRNTRVLSGNFWIAALLFYPFGIREEEATHVVWITTKKLRLLPKP